MSMETGVRRAKFKSATCQDEFANTTPSFVQNSTLQVKNLMCGGNQSFVIHHNPDTQMTNGLITRDGRGASEICTWEVGQGLRLGVLGLKGELTLQAMGLSNAVVAKHCLMRLAGFHETRVLKQERSVC